MRIGYDLSQTAENKSGTGFFADQLIRALAELDRENQYTLYHWFYDFCSPNHARATTIDQKNFKVAPLEQSTNGSVLAPQDIIHSNNFRYPWNAKAKTIVTIYDVTFLDHPEYCTEANRLVCYKNTLDAMLYADKILTISNYSKERLVHFFPSVPESKIEVIYLGNRDTMLNVPADVALIAEHGLKPEEYFLSVGTVEPRKNYETLLKAYAEYKKTTRLHKKLCIAGGYGWLQENFSARIKELGLEDDVVVTGYVSDHMLANLYRYCFAFMYLSWYEGFGLPILEAMNFKKPVITSNVTSIPEVVGEAGLTAPPADAQSFARYMKELESDDTIRTQLAEAGYAQAQKFSWRKAAEEVLTIYRSM